jgi:peptide/nickel transport system ATP-binding protein
MSLIDRFGEHLERGRESSEHGRESSEHGRESSERGRESSQPGREPSSSTPARPPQDNSPAQTHPLPASALLPTPVPSGAPATTAPVGATPLVVVDSIAKTFDVSPPWLNRLLEGKPRLLLHAVDDVSFEIARGETLALVGESGCGKSTIARMLVGLYKPSRGQVRFDGVDLSKLSSPGGRQMRSRLQMIFQDPYASLNPRWKVADIIAEPIRVHRTMSGEDAIAARTEALLRQVGLSGADAAKYPHQFSGGQRQRLSIARALASRPDFLVCDEPTSALDVSVQAQVLNLMRDIQRADGLTYLFISHNLAVVNHVADRVGVMYLGRIVELAPKRRLFEMPQHPYTRMLLDAIPVIDGSGRTRTAVSGEVPNPLNPPSGCTFHPRCPLARDRCRSERPLLRSSADGSQVACHAIEEDWS